MLHTISEDRLMPRISLHFNQVGLRVGVHMVSYRLSEIEVHLTIVSVHTRAIGEIWCAHSLIIIE
jgi:hypothetical protein